MSEVLKEAQSLANEIEGQWAAFGPELRSVISNANYEAVIFRLTNLRAAINNSLSA